jgi:hypothetical protein
LGLRIGGFTEENLITVRSGFPHQSFIKHPPGDIALTLAVGVARLSKRSEHMYPLRSTVFQDGDFSSPIDGC